MINEAIRKTKEGKIDWRYLYSPINEYIGHEQELGLDVTHYIKMRLLRRDIYTLTTRNRGYEIVAYTSNDKIKIKELINLIKQQHRDSDLEKINKALKK